MSLATCKQASNARQNNLHVNLIIHFPEVFLKLWILDDLYFHFCCELALDTWAMGFSINGLGVHDLNCTHSLVSLTMVRALMTSKCFSRLKTVYSSVAPIWGFTDIPIVKYIPLDIGRYFTSSDGGCFAASLCNEKLFLASRLAAMFAKDWW